MKSPCPLKQYLNNRRPPVASAADKWASVCLNTLRDTSVFSSNQIDGCNDVSSQGEQRLLLHLSQVLCLHASNYPNETVWQAAGWTCDLWAEVVSGFTLKSHCQSNVVSVHSSYFFFCCFHFVLNIIFVLLHLLFPYCLLCHYSLLLAL